MQIKYDVLVLGPFSNKISKNCYRTSGIPAIFHALAKRPFVEPQYWVLLSNVLFKTS